MANVFISHRLADEAESIRLAEDIRRAGHTVWLDSWEIDLGDSIIGKMNEGLEGAAYVVLCYSGIGIDAPWIKREWQAALAMQLNGKTVRILPVRLTGGTPPAILADLKYADLVRDWATGLAALLRSIK